MKAYTHMNETEVTLLPLAHMFLNLKQLHIEIFKLQQTNYYINKNTQ